MNPYQKLFDLMSSHGLTLIESEMDEIADACNPLQKFTLNDTATIYPTPEGFEKIKELLNARYKPEIAEQIFERGKVGDGWQDQLWVIIQDLRSIFFNGSPYLETTEITIG